MTAAVLREFVRRWAGRLLVAVAVVVVVAAVMGAVSWGGALALWVLLFIFALTHAGVHDTGDEGADR